MHIVLKLRIFQCHLVLCLYFSSCQVIISFHTLPTSYEITLFSFFARERKKTLLYLFCMDFLMNEYEKKLLFIQKHTAH